MNKLVAFHTLGCKLNFSETSTLSRTLEAEGFRKTDFENDADVYVINTCSVTENADKECRMLVRRIQRRAPDSLVVITGCYAQLKAEEIAKIEGVDLVLGATEKFNLASHLKKLTKADKTGAKICSCDIDDVSAFNSSFSINDRTRGFLKVQDGCDYNCSFCTIPGARGQSRSNTIDGVLSDMRQLSLAGAKEVVLTGVNLGDFGWREGHNDKRDTFFDLVRVLDEFEGIDRIRISSIEPNLLTNEIIEFVAQSKRFMPHFHIPLQSGSNKILSLMRRRYKKELYADRVATIKNLIPHCCIGIDVIVGFPGESDDDFSETVRFLEDMDVSYLHVFTYSERKNTVAETLKPVVPMHVRNLRNKALRNLSFLKMRHFTNQHIGTVRKVLFESVGNDGTLEGYTDNYIKISIPQKAEWRNEIVEWKI